MWRTHRYGTHPAQVADLALPAGRSGEPAGVAVLLHGGYWRARYDRTLQHAVAADLVAAGWAVWNVDYRAVPPGPNDGGGWPATQEDVAAAVDLLADVAPAHGLPVADPGRVVVAGHSAGGCLALWAAARHRLPAGAPGARPVVRPGRVVAQAAVCDLVAGVAQRLGDGAVEAMMGGRPDTDAARRAYALASPAALLPLGVPVLLVTGAADPVVPPVQSRAFAAAARAAGDDVTLVEVPGEGHFEHLDPGSTCWRVARSWLGDAGARMPG
jgi:acetyl esterase/lipase